MPNLKDRDAFYALVRTAARERDMALLVASEEMSALTGVSVLMSIADATTWCGFLPAGRPRRSAPTSERTRAA